MQQLQSLYRGDSSPSLAQIFGMTYQPQQATSQMANTALASGMSAGAQVKTTAMNNATQIGIADANRFQQDRHFKLTNALQNRQQSEVERNNLATNAYNQGMLANTTRTTDFNTGGNVDIADNDAAQQGQTMLTMIDTQIQALDKSDPNYNAQVAALQQRRQAIANQLAAGKKAGRGGMSGVMKVLGPELQRPLDRNGKPTHGGVADWVTGITDRVNERAKAPTAATPVAASPAAPSGSYISPNSVTSYTSSSGMRYIDLPEGVSINDFNMTPSPAAAAPRSNFATLGGAPLDLSKIVNIQPASLAYEPPAPGDAEYYQDEASTPEFRASQRGPQPPPKRKLDGLK